jgi:hypothetical protein
MVFGKKKKELEKQLAELALQKEEQERRQQWQERQMQSQILHQREEHQRKEQQWKDDQREKERRAQQLRDMEEAKIRERELQRLERMKLTTPEALRGLRDLIRTRYQLDMYIWSLKGARGPDRPLVVEKMEKADAVLMEIYTMVETWVENDRIWTAEEWRLAQMIKDRIKAEGKRWWENSPPWNEN